MYLEIEDNSKILEIINNLEPAIIFLAKEKTDLIKQLCEEIEKNNFDAYLIKYVFYIPKEEDFGLLFDERYKEAIDNSQIVAYFIPPIKDPVIFNFVDPSSLEGFYNVFREFMEKAIYNES